jgi:hypothetical protein
MSFLAVWILASLVLLIISAIALVALNSSQLDLIPKQLSTCDKQRLLGAQNEAIKARKAMLNSTEWKNFDRELRKIGGIE